MSAAPSFRALRMRLDQQAGLAQIGKCGVVTQLAIRSYGEGGPSETKIVDVSPDTVVSASGRWTVMAKLSCVAPGVGSGLPVDLAVCSSCTPPTSNARSCRRSRTSHLVTRFRGSALEVSRLHLLPSRHVERSPLFVTFDKRPATGGRERTERYQWIHRLRPDSTWPRARSCRAGCGRESRYGRIEDGWAGRVPLQAIEGRSTVRPGGV
jgi:hypothetical protein